MLLAVYLFLNHLIINVILCLCLFLCFQTVMLSVDQYRSKLSALSRLSEIVFKNTTESGCEIIDAQLKQLAADYDDLNTSTLMTKKNAETKLCELLDLLKKAEGLNTWIRDTELTLGSDPEYGKDLTEKKLLLEKLKVL